MPARTRGFTLVELMIAMILGLVVIAGVVSVFLASQRSFRTNNALADVQDSSRIAFELMARDIREAGSTGCNGTLPSKRITNVLANQTTEWWANWANAVRGYTNKSAVSDPALTSETNPVADESSLQLISASSDVSALAVDYDGSAHQFTLQSDPGYATGDILVVCSPGHAAIFQAGTVAGTVVPFGTAGTPGNSSTDLAYVDATNPLADCGSGGAHPASVCLFPINSMVSRLTAVDWYIGTNPDGRHSLYRMALANSKGTPAPDAQEMVRGVSDMSITYLNPSSGDGGFYPASSATVSTLGHGWEGVTAVRVDLTLESAFKRASVDGSKPITRSYAFTTTLRNRLD